jgi:hypothetical protein
MTPTWEEQLAAAQQRMRATGGPVKLRGRRGHGEKGKAQPTDRDRRRTELRLAGPPPEAT